MRQVAEEEVIAFAATRQGGLRLCGLRLHWPRSPLRGFCCADMGSASYCLQEGYFGAKSWARISHTWRQPLDLGPVGQDDERETRDARASYDYGCPVQATDVEGLTLSRDPEDLGPSRPRRPRPQAGARERPGAQPPPVPPAGDSDETTFRPNPARSGSPSPGGAGSGGRVAKAAHPSQFESEYREPLAPGPKWWERIFFGRVSSGQLAQFCRQFGSYLNAGVDYSRTFLSLQRQFTGSALGPAVGRMRLAIKGGSTLEEAMAREPQIFSTMFLSMIRVAEARGGVPETLRMMGNHYEARQRLIRQARSAMIYPIIVLTMAGGVIALLTIVLLPMFASLLKDIDKKVQLPLPSRAPLGLQRFRELGRLVAHSPGAGCKPVHDLSVIQDLVGQVLDRPPDPENPGLRHPLPQARYQPICSHSFHPARCRSGRGKLARPDCRRDHHDSNQSSRSRLQGKSDPGQGAERRAARLPASFPPTSWPFSRPVRKRARSPKA